MRLRSAETKPTVAVVPTDSVRPVRVHAGGLTLCMDTNEAMNLANQLADAITEIRNRSTP